MKKMVFSIYINLLCSIFDLPVLHVEEKSIHCKYIYIFSVDSFLTSDSLLGPLIPTIKLLSYFILHRALCQEG